MLWHNMQMADEGTRVCHQMSQNVSRIDPKKCHKLFERTQKSKTNYLQEDGPPCKTIISGTCLQYFQGSISSTF